MCLIDNKISDYIVSSGIKRNGQGYKYLKKSIKIAYEDPDLNCKEILEKIMENEDLSGKGKDSPGYSSIYSPMRYAIKNHINKDSSDDTVYSYISDAVDFLKREEAV